MAKGKLKNPVWMKCKCQYCEKEFDYYRESGPIRKACYECIPEGQQGNVALLRQAIKRKAVEYKGNKCSCCGGTYPYAVYDFHHLNPEEKDFGLGDKHSTVKWELVKIEIDKCILLCANCHRMVHNGDIQLEQ